MSDIYLSSGNYRCLVRTDDGWQRDRPDDLLRWLWQHDSAEIDAVVIDDAAKPKEFFCSSEVLAEQYRKEGKTALMFYDLQGKLKPSPSSPTDSPMYCNTYSILCSEREECTDDCCYKRGI